MAKKKSIKEQEIKEKAMQELSNAEEYMLITIAPKNKRGFQDTDIHISNVEMIGEAMRNLASSNRDFYNILLDIALSPYI